MAGRAGPSDQVLPSTKKKQAPAPPPPGQVPSALNAFQTRSLGPSDRRPQYGATQRNATNDPHNVTVVIARKPAVKSLFEAYLLWFPLGLLGLHHFYLRRYGFGFLYFFTLGLCGIGWLYDLFRMPGLVRKTNRKIEHPEEVDDDEYSLLDAYMLWFPLGFLGLHHFYLHRPAWGIAYIFTVGLFGVGWIIDAFRLPSLVKDANIQRAVERLDTPRQYSLCDAYALGVTPVGLFGAHHFYLRRCCFGVYYMFTLGGFGVGWIVDWFRMKCLVHRANNPYEHLLGPRHKHLDDAYVLAFPLGIIGLHHFYLERRIWGVVYFFTLGLFGVGWLVDLVRMPCLVSDTNRRLEDEMRVVAEIQEQLGAQGCDIRRKQVAIFPTPNNGNDNVNPEDFVRVPSLPGSMSETPILQPPPSYDHTVNQYGYNMRGMTPVGNPPPAYDNHAFDKQDQLPSGHQFV